MWKFQFKGQNVRGRDRAYDGTDGACPWDRRDTRQGVSHQNSLCLLVFLARGDHPNSRKKSSENAGANENLSCGFPPIPEKSLQELLRELWFSYCSSHETPFREWDLSFRELLFELREVLREYPELSESSENGLLTPRASFLKLGWSPGF